MYTIFLHPPFASAIISKPKRPKARGGAPSSLNTAINGLNLAKEVSSITPAEAVFASAGILITMIRDTMANEKDYVELGISCIDICKALNQGMDGKELDGLSEPVRNAMSDFMTAVVEIQESITKQSGRQKATRFPHAKTEKDIIAGWKSDLTEILRVFNTELAADTHITVADMDQNMPKTPKADDSRSLATQSIYLGYRETPGLTFASSMSEELPPPPPRTLFGRGELIEKVIHSAECLTPVALIGAGGIGKTSIILAALHDSRIKQRFDNNRWFIRCDQFPASRTHFLRQLSTVVGAGVENPEDLIPLRRHLSSKETIIVLDNVESILDPRGTSSQDIYAIVDELSRFSNICLIITSRISTISPRFETIDIPTLPTKAAHDAFYHIYRRSGQSGSINNILKRLDFHPLSITLLATAAQHNQWDTKRLVAEWERQRTGVLPAQHLRSLATTIELSLASPMFQELGPDARGLLEVVAFLPQGVKEDNADRLFPTISDRRNLFDRFCTLSLTYRSNGFVTMLAPLRDYLRPKDLMSSQLLRTTKECYFTWLSADATPGKSNLDESRLVTSEDANVEHLLDVFTSIDANSEKVWDACTGFMEHLYWHKPRLVVLGPKIEALPDNHPSKARCLRGLARLFSSVGHWVEQKRILTHTLEFWREKGDEYQVAQTLSMLCDANRLLELEEEGIQQGREASELLGRLGNTTEQAECLIALAWVLYDDDQLDAAEEAASRAIDLLQKEDEQLNVCHCHRVLGEVYHSKGEAEKAIHHFEAALEAASSTNWCTQLFGLHFSLAQLFSQERRSYEARKHLEHAEAQAADNPYLLARAMCLQAWIMNDTCMFKEAKSEALRALDTFEELGAADDVETTRHLLGHIESNARGLDLDLVVAGSDK